MIYLGADHGGFEKKGVVKAYLKERGYSVTDMGPQVKDENDDYPIVGEKVARKVAEDPNNRGVLLCRSGAGVCIVANKIKGIRAAQAWNAEVARAVRNDDDANILCLAADQLDLEEIKKIVQIFLDTSLGTEERYRRRLQEIQDLESRT